MKYQVFNQEEGELKQIQDLCEMLKGALAKCLAEHKRLIEHTEERYSMAKEYEEKYGSADALTQSAWTSWGNAYDDRQAVEARIEEIQDAMRFNARLLKGSY